MSLEKARAYIEAKGFGERVMTFEISSATVELAAVAVGTQPERIAKSLTFKASGEPIMIICAGDAKIANSKYKGFFHEKAVMLTRDEVSELIGHEVGGVCPFGINDGVTVYLDESLRRFDTVYPACGDAASAVRLSPDELETLSGAKQWIDVCNVPEQR